MQKKTLLRYSPGEKFRNLPNITLKRGRPFGVTLQQVLSVRTQCDHELT